MAEEKKTWYDPKHNASKYAYYQRSIKRIPLDMLKSYYEEEVKPAADALGIPVNTFVKQAIAEKIERMKEEK